MGLRAGMVAAQGTWAHGAQGTRRTEYSIVVEPTAATIQQKIR